MGFFSRMLAVEPDPLSNYSDDELQAAALDVLKERPNSSPSWIGGTVKQCDAALAHIERLRKKYETYEPRRMRLAIMGWLDYYERQALKDRRDCETNKSRREQDEYSARRQAENRRTANLLDDLRKIQKQ